MSGFGSCSARQMLALVVDGLIAIERRRRGEDQRLPVAAGRRVIAARVVDLRLVIEREIAKRIAGREKRREFRAASAGSLFSISARACRYASDHCA